MHTNTQGIRKARKGWMASAGSVPEKIRSRLKTAFPKSLRSQLLSRSLLVMAGLLVLIGRLQYVLMKDFLYRNKAETLQSQILSAPRDAWQQIASGPAAAGGIRLPFLFMPDSGVGFIDTDGDFSLLSIAPGQTMPPQLSPDEYLGAMRQEHHIGYKLMTDAAGKEQLIVLQPIVQKGQQIGMIQVSLGTGPLQAVLLRRLSTFMLLALLAMLIGFLTFRPVLRTTLVPLSAMVENMERIDAGNLDTRFPVSQGQAEIDRLALSFNGMLFRLEASFEAEKEAKEQMRRFVADASHELRTPLTSIHGFLEVLLRGAMNNREQLERALRSMHGESERINKLVQDLLLLARLDRAPDILLAEGRLDQVVAEMEPQLRLLAGSRDVRLRLAPHRSLLFDKDKMKQVVLNLFHNAVQHTDPERGRIDISLDLLPEGGLRLAVKDNGSGIPVEHLPHVFDRFYRSDSSRTRKHGGSGLGLAISRSIAQAHGGTIHVESREGEGTLFYILLPAAPPALPEIHS
ncbi:HAMP domain-containing histidine kinase [Paenibacillus sp. P25]|nr:HAMP domain-containing histidine kinase [Paenibacillus sp. P25]